MMFGQDKHINSKYELFGGGNDFIMGLENCIHNENRNKWNMSFALT